MLRAFTHLFKARFVPTTVQHVGNSNIYIYGIDNLLPNTNLRLINDSGIAKKACGKLSRYIQADGFADKNAANFKVNKDQTADQLLAENSSYCAYNKGVAFTIQRNIDGTIKEMRSIAFECIRVRKDGNYTYNPLLGQKDFKEADTKVHPKYFGLNPTVEQLQLIAKAETLDEKGKVIKNPFYQNLEIFYVFEKTADNLQYPVPDYVAGIEDIRTSVELQGLDLDTVRNGFMTSAILTVPKMDGETKDAQNKTERDYFDEAIKAMTGNVKDAHGLSRRNAITTIEVESMEQAPTFQQWDSKVLVEASINKRDQIERSVARWIGVHPVLLGYSDASILGNTQAIANASKDLTDFVNPLQRMISNAYKQVFPQFDWTISQFNFWATIPNEVYNVLTEDEKRAIAGYQPLEKKTTSEAEQTIAAINSLSPLVANKVLESMTKEEIRSLVGLKTTLIETVSTNGTN